MIRKTDDFPLECAITIDLKTKQIDFRHLTERKSKGWIAVNMVMPTLQGFISRLMVLFTPLYWLIIVYFLASFIQDNIIIWDLWYFIVFSGLIFCMTLYFPLIAYVLVYLPNFPSWFPKFGHATAQFQNPGNKHHVHPEDIKNKIYEIPLFRNVYLSYDCYGEFNDRISKIEIVEHRIHFNLMKPSKIKRCFHWTARFYFDRKPKKGFMIVDYI